MHSSSSILDSQLCENDLLPINYRICMDYGEVEIAMSDNFNEGDLFVPIVNEYSKMDNLVSLRELYLGKKLYNRVSKPQFINKFTVNKVNIQNNSSNSLKSGVNYTLSFIDFQNKYPIFIDTRGYEIKNGNFTVNVIGPLTSQEEFKNFWLTYGSMITSIGAGICWRPVILILVIYEGTKEQES